MRQVLLSIIIPCHNRVDKLILLLDSINQSAFTNFEIIVVDDGSRQDIASPIKKYPKGRYFRLPQKSGPGRARNFGAGKAKGKILVFLDSDLILYRKTLSEIAKVFKDDQVAAVSGIYSKIPANNNFSAEFKALKDYYHWVIDRDWRFAEIFAARLGAIKKSVFEKIGGFTTKYKGADVEDYEFSYRLNKEYSIHFEPKIQAKHHFPSLMVTAKNYFYRSGMWAQIFVNNKKFDNVGVTPKESMVTFLVPLSLLFLVLSYWFPKLIWVSIILFLGHIIFYRKFLSFIFKEKGVIFMIEAFLINLLMILVIYLGAFWAFLRPIQRRNGVESNS